MEDKIRKYVDYQFRFDKRENLDDLKEEIVANLLDRYHEYLRNGKDPQEAYIEAIKSMGDFTEDHSNEIPSEYSFKPTIPDILLMCSTIMSIFGLIIFFLSNIIGTIITAISIITYSCSAYYLYSYSQYVRKEEMDIEKHNLLLSKIFKYLKTNFIFWVINLSFIFTSLIMGLISSIVLIDPEAALFTDVGTFILVYMILYCIFLTILIIIFYKIYQRLMNYYYLLTGTNYIKSKIHESWEFLFGKDMKNKLRRFIITNDFIAIILILMMFINFFILVKLKHIDLNFGIIIYKNELYISYILKYFFSKHITEVLLAVFFLIYNIIFIVITFTKRIKSKTYPLIIGGYGWLIGGIIIYTYLAYTKLNDRILIYDIIMFILFTLTLIIHYRLKSKMKNE